MVSKLSFGDEITFVFYVMSKNSVHSLRRFLEMARNENSFSLLFFSENHNAKNVKSGVLRAEFYQVLTGDIIKVLSSETRKRCR